MIIWTVSEWLKRVGERGGPRIISMNDVSFLVNKARGSNPAEHCRQYSNVPCRYMCPRTIGMTQWGFEERNSNNRNRRLITEACITCIFVS